MEFESRNAKRKSTACTGALVVMRSIEQGPNPQVPVNQAIPNFPGTPDDITLMNGTFPLLVLHFFSILAKLIIILIGLQCRNLLTSLETPIPQGPQVRTRHLRTAVREAIGLPAI